ncbi:cytochrome P450 [Apiospora marii]|uniref:cytochrome P450 n=1 Tax=Apiospora marii TaxID=335849 RepID=UPI00312D7A28
MESATTLINYSGRATLDLGCGLLWIVLPVIALLSFGVFLHQRDPLRHYPGPFLARFTNLWRLYITWRGQSHVVIHELHKKFGPVVRLGPSMLDLDILDFIKVVYSTKAQWKKTEFYHGSSSIVDGKIVYNIFSQTDQETHAQWRKPISKHYSTNGVLPFESHIDNVLSELCTALESRYINGSNGSACCLDKWLLYFAWDVVGTVTFSQPIGFLEKGCDFNGVLHAAAKSTDYFAVVGQMPFLDHWLDKNPIHRIGPPSFGAAISMAVQHLVDRYQGTDGAYYDPARPDYLDKFIEVKELNPETVDSSMIISYLMINLIAGSDTTAITLRSVFYYTLRNHAAWSRLQKELDIAVKDKSKPVSWAETRSCPYLEAVMREAIRMLPGVAMNLERYVPQGGLTVPPTTSNKNNGKDQNNRFIPGGTIVGLNPYVLARNLSVYGEDADEFRPARWLQGKEEPGAAYKARLAVMNAADLSFGAGSRVCIGKNLALLEAYKAVATLVVRYDIELVEPASQWRITNSWFPRQEGGLDVRLKMRTAASS